MLPYSEIIKLSIDHNYETRLKVSNAIKTNKFTTNKGQRSMLFKAAKLFNKYLYDFESMTSGMVKSRLVDCLWKEYGAAGWGLLAVMVGEGFFIL